MGRTLLLVAPEVARGQLVDALAQGRSLQLQVAADEDLRLLWSKWKSWTSLARTTLEQMFETSGGIMTASPASEFGASLSTGLMTGELTGIGNLDQAQADDVRSALKEEVPERIRRLESIRDRLELYPSALPSLAEVAKPSFDGPIFIVHGRNLEVRGQVECFIAQCTTKKSVILSDQPNRGLDILGKFEAEARQASFVVVLMTADDEGRLREDGGPYRSRARQNVIFELGYFVGLLGRERVAVLYEQDVEQPSDFLGVVYIPLDGGWQLAFGRELKAAGVEVDMNNAL